MPETKQLLRETRDRIAPPPDVLGGLERRRRHQENVKRVAAAAVAIVVALVGLGGWFVLERVPAQRPADRSEDLGIFAPVAGRIVYVNGVEVGYNDLGYDPGLWAIDPIGPSDTTVGPNVADDVASALVRLGPRDMIPLAWSRDGTELLFKRTSEDLIPQEYLYVLHTDGSETRLNRDPMYFGGATISPDGTRVVFTVQAVPADDLGLYVVDAEGGRPVRLPDASPTFAADALTFSPDGSQIAYLGDGNDVAGNVDEEHVWVADADGGNAHEILADEPTLFAGVTGLQWSPTGDRLAIGVGDHEGGGRPAIYTFAPDGSDFTKVIDGGISPYWAPDGSRIAYTIPCDEHPDAGSCPEGSIRRSEFDPQPGDLPAGLAIADADGSDARAFGFAASGPWHPGASATDEPTTPVPTIWSPVRESGASVVHRSSTWFDPDDAPVDWVDLERVYFHVRYEPTWDIGLAADPPLAVDLDPGLLIAYGLVLETTGDGVADYVVGIDNDTLERGDFRVWVTDLATDETHDQIGPPYGYPIEFVHPDEPGGPPAVTFWFLPGSAPADLNPETVRFYAWASASSGGEVFATDFAPDTGWLTGIDAVDDILPHVGGRTR